VAIDALRAAAHPHSFIGVTEQGLAANVTTTGNDETHIILRGGERGTNYDPENVQKALDALERGRLPRRLMIDTSHGNSGKDHNRQPQVAHEIAEQIAGGQRGIVGIMLESFLVDGRQDPGPPSTLTYGQSITDACMGWEMTAPVLRDLAAAVRSRREARVAVTA
jgi:3-deoxy-7-phosphoheptulonate synthase